MFKATRHLVSGLTIAVALTGATRTVSTQVTIGDGLINVAVNDVNVLNNVDIGVAAQLAANICGVKVGPVAVLGAAVDRRGGERTVCMSDQGPVTVRQN